MIVWEILTEISLWLAALNLLEIFFIYVNIFPEVFDVNDAEMYFLLTIYARFVSVQEFIFRFSVCVLFRSQFAASIMELGNIRFEKPKKSSKSSYNISGNFCTCNLEDDDGAGFAMFLQINIFYCQRFCSILEKKQGQMAQKATIFETFDAEV